MKVSVRVIRPRFSDPVRAWMPNQKLLPGALKRLASGELEAALIAIIADRISSEGRNALRAYKKKISQTRGSYGSVERAIARAVCNRFGGIKATIEFAELDRE